jgi:hypothetical protein
MDLDWGNIYENEEFGCNERRDKRITNPTVD